jgi:adenine deaminase
MANPHDIGGAVVLAGLEFPVEMTKGLPLKFFFTLPVSSPPFPEFEGEDVVPLALSFLDQARDPGSQRSDPLGQVDLHDNRLNALAAAGLTSCHEALNAGRARERLRLRLAVMLHHGSIRSELEALMGLVTKEPQVDTADVETGITRALTALLARFGANFLSLSALPWIKLTPSGL